MHPPPYKVRLDEMPQLMDRVVSIEYESGEYDFYLRFQPTRLFLARYMLATPRTLIRHAFSIWWFDFKQVLLGADKRPIETVEHFEQRRKYSSRKARKQAEADLKSGKYGTYVEGKRDRTNSQ